MSSALGLLECRCRQAFLARVSADLFCRATTWRMQRSPRLCESCQWHSSGYYKLPVSQHEYMLPRQSPYQRSRRVVTGAIIDPWSTGGAPRITTARSFNESPYLNTSATWHTQIWRYISWGKVRRFTNATVFQEVQQPGNTIPETVVTTPAPRLEGDHMMIRRVKCPGLRLFG